MKLPKQLSTVPPVKLTAENNAHLLAMSTMLNNSLINQPQSGIYLKAAHFSGFLCRFIVLALTVQNTIVMIRDQFP